LYFEFTKAEIINRCENKYDGMMDMVADINASFIHNYIIVLCYCIEKICSKKGLPKS